MNFTKDIISTIPLSVYNNNIVEFLPTENNKEIVNAIISINGNDFEITPNLNRTFRFNIKSLAMVLTNQNNFKDSVEPDVNQNIINNDCTLYNELSIDFTINFDDETNETESKVIKLIKSVKQIIRDKSELDYRLFPLVKKYKNQYNLTCFEGYPFDFSFYSDTDREISIKNQTNQQEVTLNIVKGVNRFFISDGLQNTSITNTFPLIIGTNEIIFKIANEKIFTIFLKQNDAICTSSYLKYFNQSGSFSYWLFPKYKSNSLSTRIIDELENDFEDINNTTSNFSITGKTAEEEINTISQLLDESEKEYLKEIFLSPKVYLLNNERFTETTLDDWSEVKIKDINLNLPPKNTRNRLPIKIELPKLYTQTL